VRTRAYVPPDVWPSRHARIGFFSAESTLHQAASPFLLIPRARSNKKLILQCKHCTIDHPCFTTGNFGWKKWNRVKWIILGKERRERYTWKRLQVSDRR